MEKSLQIILMGWEWDRLLYGMKEYPQKKAILVCSSEKKQPQWTKPTENITKNLIERIKDVIDTEVVRVNYYDFDECLFTLSKIIEENVEKYDAISINISTGSKILVTAAILVSQYYPVELFYVVPKKYNIPKNIPYFTSGFREIIKLPTFNIKGLVIPTKKQKEIFSELEHGKISFSDLVKKYASKRGISLDRRKTENMKSLFFYHLKKLEEKGLIKMKVENNQMFISLTTTGKFVHRVMKNRD